MPGHVKLGNTGEPDPDPMPFLVVSSEVKRQDMHKFYDAKKSVWIPNLKDGGYEEGLLQEDDGNKAIVLVGHEKKTCATGEAAQVNPPKFEKCPDMADLTFLNEASVYHNLKSRYVNQIIYTYSGLFCVVVNPYKRFPIYTQRVVKIYLGKKRNEVPPHLWAITEIAYRNMLHDSKNQSMLITGESGAGKTENTKKVISYLAMVAASSKKTQNKVSIEDKIVATNPIMETYGNAKTSRNDNSSRFGKFIRIYFSPSGKLAGGDIQSYILEKSRITMQQEVERSYHIFYQLFQPHVTTMKQKCLLTDDIYDYSFVSQGKTIVPSIDDNEDLEYTHNAFDILGFSEEETWNCYKITAAVMSMGEVKFKQKGRDEQCEPDDLTFSKKVAELYGINVDEMMKGFCKPKIKVGTEWVTKGQNIEQSTNAVGALARATYNRLFNYLVEKCNETLIEKGAKRSHFVGVLDIAGFEIFDYNGYEQISINFVNEKLQQFFNHHMFVVEQQEYISQGIDWVMVDFGMDLAACINMFEKPMGIWAILEEESMFPKATDKTFEDKLKAQYLGKSHIFAKAQSKTDKNAHFAVIHYAGTVSYNVTGWLEKNKDPVNDTVVDVFKKSSNKLLSRLYSDHPGQSSPQDETGGKKKKKGGGSKTVSSAFLVQLNDLMTSLHSTDPHFIRCIVPNYNKKPGEMSSALVMHQLKCNGVLEGIRICMRGFPNRMLYHEFKTRYEILGSKHLKSGMTDKESAQVLMDQTKMDDTKFKLGHTKIFFRAGMLAHLEDVRDVIVKKLVCWLQGACYGSLKRRVYMKKRDVKELVTVIQRNFRKYLRLRNWGWFIIIQKTRPLIGQVNMEEELRILEEKCNSTYGSYERVLREKTEVIKSCVVLENQLEDLRKQVENEQGSITEYSERQAKASAQKADFEVQLQELSDKLSVMEQERQNASHNKKSSESIISGLKKEIADIDISIQREEQEKANRDHVISSITGDINGLDENVNRVNKQKKQILEANTKALEQLQIAENKLDALGRTKQKLEQTSDELEDALQHERRLKSDVDKQRRRLEGELRVLNETIEENERGRKEDENVLIKKDKEICELSSKLDEEQSLMGKSQKHIKEVQIRVEELEEELEAERQARGKAERQRADLTRELEELGDRLTEASGATAAQMELNKKRENELLKLRKDLEESHIHRESTMTHLKRRHQDAVNEISEQIEHLNKLKSRVDKDKLQMAHEISEIRSATDEVNRSKVSAEKTHKNLQSQLNDNLKRIEQENLQISDIEKDKKKLVTTANDLLRQCQDLENAVKMIQKVRSQLTSDLEEVKRNADDETRERLSLLSKYRNAEHELEGLKGQMDEEIANREDASRQYQKVNQEAEEWRQRYEKEILVKAEELEMTKLKLQARLAESQGTLENMNLKLSQLEKAKFKLQSDVDELTSQTDQASILNNSLEKKAKQFDRIVGEWKYRVDSLSTDLDNSIREGRDASSELFKVKSTYEECTTHLDEVKKENKNLTNEIKDLMNQISEGGRSIHEIDKIRKRLETEKLELHSALEEAECALEQEENKTLRLQFEINQAKQDIERRLNEKDNEFLNTRKSFQKVIDGLQSSLESEAKGKAEAIRMKKKLESDVNELNIALEHANAAALETQRTVQGNQNDIRQTQVRYEEEQRSKEIARDTLITSERKTNTVQNSLEEARTILEQADRARRQLEQELSDSNEELSDLTCQNQSLAAAKRKIESDIQTLNTDLDEMSSEARVAEERTKKAMIDAARMADELRSEQELAQMLEKDKKMNEGLLKDLQDRLDEVESTAMKSGKKAVSKMEARIRELECELDSESRRLNDSHKNVRKTERKIKEMTFAIEEDRKNQERMHNLIDQLQNKIRTYKKQIEEAEEIAAQNLAKYRFVQTSVTDSEQRAELNEQALARQRAKDRATSLAPL